MQIKLFYHVLISALQQDRFIKEKKKICRIFSNFFREGKELMTK